MQKNKFDILPIQEADGTFKKYLKAKECGDVGANDIRIVRNLIRFPYLSLFQIFP